LSSGLGERIGTEECYLKLSDLEKVKHEEKLPLADHRSALLRVVEILSKDGRFDCKAIGHRVVHGGEYFREPVLITEDVVQKIEELAILAPLHNPAHVLGIRVATELFPGKPQVAVFDTAFHQTLPPYAFHYAIPYEYYEKYRVRRYGFHGTSHHYVTLEAARRLGKPYDQLQFISAHLGNGCSATAVKHGRSVDTTMGLTPLEGLVMGTRSGDVDPSLLLFLQQREGLRLAEIIEILTRKSGLLGVSGVSHDMRSVIAAADDGNPRAQLAIDLFCHRLGRAILGLAASLTSIDGVIFTGGVGENSALIRAKVLSHLAILHPEIDPKLNEQHGKQSNGRISSGSGLLCLVIPTNEELMIARETDRLTP
jgi:acetate kinase